MAGTYNISIDQGASWSIGVQVKSGVNVLDLTGYTIACQFKPSLSSTTVLVSPTCTILSPSTAGNITISLTPTQTMALPAAPSYYSKVPQAYYDVIMTSPGGVVTRLMQGTVSVAPQVTP